MEVQEFRCPICSRLLCKLSKDSVVEIKCHKCKAVVKFDYGQVTLTSPPDEERMKHLGVHKIDKENSNDKDFNLTAPVD